MPDFEDLSREIRDMIYAYAVASDHVLVAVGEYPGSPGLKHEFPLPLLRVSRRVREEAIESFYALNTFKISLSPLLGAPSVFTKYATLFRSVRVRFSFKAFAEYLDFEDWRLDDIAKFWKERLRVLAPMIKLRRLYLDIVGCLELGSKIDMVQRAITDRLEPELLKSLTLGNRKEQGVFMTIVLTASDVRLLAPFQYRAVFEVSKDLGSKKVFMKVSLKV
ncbi:MAG: hypothetical protein Q9191_005089 [Dirinaria sp. TL-2023a]